MPQTISFASLISACLSLLALAVALYLPWRWRDWRLAFLAGLATLIVAGQSPRLFAGSIDWSMPLVNGLSDFRNLVLSAIVFLAVFFVDRILVERRQSEDALRRGDKRFRDLIDGSIQGYLILSKDWELLFANHAITKIFGYDSVEELVALGDAGALLAPFERERVKAMADTSPGGESTPSQYEMHGIRKDGTRIWLHIHSRRVEWEGHAAIQSTVVDISELKQREAELKSAKELAEVASRTKTEFLANMSHELRTPLTAIIGFSEVLESEMFGPHSNPAYKEYAGDIRSSGAHLLDVINDILDVSKIEAGKVELHEEAVAVGQLVEAALTLVRERAEEGGLALVNNVTAGPLLIADPRLLKQILVNLLSNAVKFTPLGGKVTIESGLTDDNCFELRVADTGIGIAPENLETVMMPFRQADGGLSRTHEGTGLGLPLAKSLAQLHDGDIELTSEPGVGTTATLRLPEKRVVQLQAAE